MYDFVALLPSITTVATHMIGSVAHDLPHLAHELPHLLAEAPHLIHQHLDSVIERREFRHALTA